MFGSFPTATTRFLKVSPHRRREVLNQNSISPLLAQIQATASHYSHGFVWRPAPNAYKLTSTFRFVSNSIKQLSKPIMLPYYIQI